MKKETSPAGSRLYDSGWLFEFEQTRVEACSCTRDRVSSRRRNESLRGRTRLRSHSLMVEACRVSVYAWRTAGIREWVRVYCYSRPLGDFPLWAVPHIYPSVSVDHAKLQLFRLNENANCACSAGIIRCTQTIITKVGPFEETFYLSSLNNQLFIEDLDIRISKTIHFLGLDRCNDESKTNGVEVERKFDSNGNS